MSSTTLTFVGVRSQALAFENQTLKLLTSYSSFAQSPTAHPTQKELALEKEIANLLKQRDATVENLNNFEKFENLVPSRSQQLQRHNEVLQENYRDFNNIKLSIKQERERINLLISVRSDIEAHKRRNNDTSSNQFLNDENDYINNERERADNANSIADRLLAQAYETRSEFQRQRSVLSGVNKKMFSVLSTIPGINVLLGKINTRRKRDAIIIASLISVCIILIWLTS
ncbi:Gos1p [Ascoidea rubescens DSM 1968]|uniref:Golgi SNAP receptor complex member 1 n=1 Tax=Ascoidea rubescens DSM 1968 TaxID=1344418 RepID=A0A1D2VFZ8_9ASCO|nr:V-snare-domain-containing protein [Ascoidea rubescens DSM 1968]ODV60443.1 V-snare-domain-containing protein [Ascoidea rubescens DSM 1968]